MFGTGAAHIDLFKAIYGTCIAFTEGEISRIMWSIVFCAHKPYAGSQLILSEASWYSNQHCKCYGYCVESLVLSQCIGGSKMPAGCLRYYHQEI